MLPINHHELVGIIVLNWNNWRDTIRCMESLKKSDYSPCHITVIDNGSLNDSVIQLSAYYEKSGYDTTNTVSFIPQIFTHKRSDFHQNYQVQVKFANDDLSFVCVSQNSGFVGGMNIGLYFLMEYFSPHLLLLLNNDRTYAVGMLWPKKSFQYKWPSSKQSDLIRKEVLR